jgi:hypothetical protein
MDFLFNPFKNNSLVMATVQHRLSAPQGFLKAAFLKKAILCSGILLLFLSSHAQEINLYSGCNMVLNGSVNVVINNIALKNNGTFTAGSSTVFFTGNTDTTISYISGSSYTRFNNLTVDKSAYGTAVKSAAGVKNILTLTTGYLYADSNLTLLSDASNTARLAAVTPGADVLGKTLVERYIPSKRAWRLMTAPVTNGSDIYNCWQNNGVYSVGKGLLVSGPGGGNGLDNGNAASLKTWDVASQALAPVSNTHTKISATNTGSADNTGYFVFIRGDRNPTNFIIPNSNITTITGVGKLQTGTQTFTAATTAGKYTLIGNPYASPINFSNVTRTNLVKRFYVWDPTLNTMGGFVTLDDVDNDGVYSKSVAGSAQTKEIQSTQAFFVETSSNGAASLTFTESAKSTNNNINVFRPMAAPGSIRADLYLLNSDSSVVLADGVLAEYNSLFNDSVSNEDALKFSNINESVAFARYGKSLAIERRPLIDVSDTLFIKLSKTTLRNYQLQLTAAGLDQQGLLAFFEDRYLSTITPLDLSVTTVVNFLVNADPASAGSGRFRIIFRPLSVLPVVFVSVKAYQVNDKIQVAWKAGDEGSTMSYEVEKSVDGINFTSVKTIGKNNTGNYAWTDMNAIAGKNIYRIKNIANDGAAQYSATVIVWIAKKNTHFSVEPNPVKGNSIQLHFANQPTGMYHFNLMNNAGQLVYSTSRHISNSSTLQVMNTNTALAAGMYQLQITGPSGIIETQQLIIQQ